MKRAPNETIYTIFVDDNPVVVLEASGRGASELCKELWFQAELSALKSNGEPVYGGKSKLCARPAIEDERVKYRDALKEAKPSGEILLVYLVELDGA